MAGNQLDQTDCDGYYLALWLAMLSRSYGQAEMFKITM
jgi:hypothetical protein